MRRRGRAEPGHALVGGVADGSLGGVEHRQEAQHTIMRGAAAAGSNGYGRGVAAVFEAFGQGRDDVLADFYGRIDAVLSVTLTSM